MLADLLAIDLDGTFLTSERMPHFAGISAVIEAREAGLRVLFASGRTRPSMLTFAEPLGISNPMICANGGQIYDLSGEEVEAHLLPPDAFETVLTYAEENEINLNVYTRNELLYLREDDEGLAHAKRVRSVLPRVTTLEEIRTRNVLKVLIRDEPSKIPAHRAALEARLDLSTSRLTESEANYLEISHCLATKGNALKSLSELLGVPRHRVAAIGDYLNDVEMLEFAEVSAAVSSGAPATRAAAKRIVPSNDEGGVATFIHQILAG